MGIIRVACLQARFVPDFFIAMKEVPVKKGGGHDLRRSGLETPL